MAKKKESALDRLIKKLTKATPIEKESSVKLDHDFDGIEELNNPLPPWWTMGFVITVIIAVLYIGYYFMNYYDIHKIGKWQEMELKNEMAKAEALKKQKEKENPPKKIEEIVLLTDQKDLEDGKKIFAKNCASCHLADGGGVVGPNLTDNSWIYGCDIKDVFNIIAEGSKDKRMPAWKKSLGDEKVLKVASYVLSLQGTTPANPKEPEGEPCNK